MAVPSLRDHLDSLAPQERPGAVVQALRQLARKTARDLVEMCRLAHEAREGRYWSKVSKADGSPYLSETEFLEDVLEVDSWRTAMRRLKIGAAINAVPTEEREEIAAQIADLGPSKASVLAPVLETSDPDQIRGWLERAKDTPVIDLQKQVSDELGARPRGTGGGDQIERYLRNLMPSPEARELYDEFLKLGSREAGGNSVVGILIAAMQECVGTWSAKP